MSKRMIERDDDKDFSFLYSISMSEFKIMFERFNLLFFYLCYFLLRKVAISPFFHMPYVATFFSVGSFLKSHKVIENG